MMQLNHRVCCYTEAHPYFSQKETSEVQIGLAIFVKLLKNYEGKISIKGALTRSLPWPPDLHKLF